MIFVDQHQQRAASRTYISSPAPLPEPTKGLFWHANVVPQAKHVYGAAEWIPLGCERIFVRPTILLDGRMAWATFFRLFQLLFMEGQRDGVYLMRKSCDEMCRDC
jgi:hypothetical protein